MYYWKKIRNDMKMAADLRAMHRAKPREISLYGPVDTDGHRSVTGTRIEFDRIPRRELHRLATGM